MNVKEKLLKVQSELKAQKTKVNNFSPSKFKYRSAEDILEAVKPLLVEAKLLQIMTDEIIEISDRFYVKATVTVIDTEKEDSISVSAFAREVEIKKSFDEAQITGSSSSYARKYALNGMYNIDDGNDADGEDNTKKGEPTAKATAKATAKPTAKEDDEITRDMVFYNAEQKGFDKDKVVALWKKQYKDKADTKNKVQIQKMLDIIELVEEWDVFKDADK